MADIVSINVSIHLNELKSGLMDYIENVIGLNSSSYKLLITDGRTAFSKIVKIINLTIESSNCSIISEYDYASGVLYFKDFSIKTYDNGFYNRSSSGTVTGLDAMDVFIQYLEKELTDHGREGTMIVSQDFNHIYQIENSKVEQELYPCACDLKGNVYGRFTKNCHISSDIINDEHFSTEEPLTFKYSLFVWLKENGFTKDSTWTPAQFVEHATKFIVTKREEGLDRNIFLELFKQLGVLGFEDNTYKKIYDLFFNGGM